ncbi:MAG: glycoside hydrolase family 1 protein [Chloroflexi bacterium]|nr:glycoside hydrolase family 1 protein [Chloroflexota bacterium]
MPEATFHFPRGFLWGTATAAHQVEGNNTNNSWYQWENIPGKILNGQKSGIACDWWGGRWKEDLERARDTGQNAHRLSVEWSRIQPYAEVWDDEALAKYVEMVRWLHNNQMTPLVTLHHFSDPLWLTTQGGWESGETPALFARFARKVVSALKDYVNLWVTINEPNVYVMTGWIAGSFPPGKSNLGLAAQVVVNLVRGHAAAYKVIHELQPEAQVGLATNYRSIKPARANHPLDKLVSGIQRRLFNDSFNNSLKDGKLDLVFKKVVIPEAAGTQDFIGLNYYSRDMVRFDITKPHSLFGRNEYPKNAQLSMNGFIANVPEGMWDGLKWANQFKLPILITENGIEDEVDTLRPRYMIEHLHQVWKACNFNWRVKGYFHWSLVDNFEWERAWSQRFGLWGLDVDTQERTRRKSVDVYEAICKENGIASQTVQKYAPEIFDSLFPS